MADWDLLLTEARIATMAANRPGYGEIADAALAIDPDDASPLLIGVTHRGDLAEGHRGASALGNHRRPNLIQVDELGWRTEGHFVPALLDFSRR